jgi:hypothetical protein
MTKSTLAASPILCARVGGGLLISLPPHFGHPTSLGEQLKPYLSGAQQLPVHEILSSVPAGIEPATC